MRFTLIGLLSLASAFASCRPRDFNSIDADVSESSSTKREAVFMFYLDNQTGDHIDGYVNRHFSKLESIELRNSAYIVAAFGVEKDINIYTLENRNWKKMNTLKNASFSDAASLSALLESGFALKANKYILTLSDHGFADQGLMYVAKPSNGKNVLSNEEVRDSIANAKERYKKNLDILYFDACLMSSIESLFQYTVCKENACSPVADFIVASENTTVHPGGLDLGGAITKVVGRLGRGGPTTREIGLDLVESSKGNRQADFTMIDMTQLNKAQIDLGISAITSGATRCLDLLTKKRAQLFADRIGAETIVDGHRGDLIGILNIVSDFCPDQSSEIASILKKLKNEIIIATEVDDPNRGKIQRGISIRVSPPAIIKRQVPNYPKNNFVLKSNWMVLLSAIGKTIDRGNM